MTIDERTQNLARCRDLRLVSNRNQALIILLAPGILVVTRRNPKRLRIQSRMVFLALTQELDRHPVLVQVARWANQEMVQVMVRVVAKVQELDRHPALGQVARWVNQEMVQVMVQVVAKVGPG